MYQHLKPNTRTKPYLKYVNLCEDESIERVSQDIMRNSNIEFETKRNQKCRVEGLMQQEGLNTMKDIDRYRHERYRYERYRYERYRY